VTERVTGLDLVELQLAVAAGEALPPAALDPPLHGHAIEVRLTAEDPAAGYRPASGAFTTFEVDDLGGAVRVDAGVVSGSSVPPYYDSMVAKVIAHAPTRAGAARTLASALERARLHGPATNRDQLVRILRHPQFLAGDLHTGFLDEHPCMEPIEGDVQLAAVAVALAEQAANRAAARAWTDIPSGWRNNPAVERSITLVRGEATTTVTYRLGRDGSIAVDGQPVDVGLIDATSERVVLAAEGLQRTLCIVRDGSRRYVDADDGHVTFVVLPRHPEPDTRLAAGSLVAPMPGGVVRVLVVQGDAVLAGQPLVVVEAMKMEHQIHAPADGAVAEVFVQPGEQVDTGQVLLRLADDQEPSEA
jgi:propionyl-CoA carboxylase alpha chain